MQKASVWAEKVMIPTYEIGEAEKDPIFLEKRVYQGSCGKVYPYPTIEKISDEKKDKEYTAVWLENEYIKVMVLPELGGRIQRAYDKTNDYDFVYYNQVIKPALVGGFQEVLNLTGRSIIVRQHFFQLIMKFRKMRMEAFLFYVMTWIRCMEQRDL